MLDEADRLMDLGFEKDITKICDFVKTKRDSFVRSRLQVLTRPAGLVRIYSVYLLYWYKGEFAKTKRESFVRRRRQVRSLLALQV